MSTSTIAFGMAKAEWNPDFPDDPKFTGPATMWLYDLHAYNVELAEIEIQCQAEDLSLTRGEALAALMFG